MLLYENILSFLDRFLADEEDLDPTAFYAKYHLNTGRNLSFHRQPTNPSPSRRPAVIPSRWPAAEQYYARQRAARNARLPAGLTAAIDVEKSAQIYPPSEPHQYELINYLHLN